MNKKNKIWGIILGIIAIGVFITHLTSEFVVSQESKMHADAKDAHDLEDSMQWITDERERLAESTQSSVISPLETTTSARKDRIYPQSESDLALTEVETDHNLSGYTRRLAELDKQIAIMKKEEISSNNYSMKAIVENEYKRWDGERTVIYTAILEHLDKEEADQFVQDEKNWLKERDQQALEVAGKNVSGANAIDSLEYTATLSILTRQKVYDLVANYQVILDPLT